MKANYLVEKMNNGETISLRPVGNFMTPKIKSKQKVTLEPLGDYNPVENDIVFCKVKGRYFIHLVTACRDGQWQISNNHGHVNGWTTKDKIFGRVIKVEP